MRRHLRGIGSLMAILTVAVTAACSSQVNGSSEPPAGVSAVSAAPSATVMSSAPVSSAPESSVAPVSSGPVSSGPASVPVSSAVESAPASSASTPFTPPSLPLPSPTTPTTVFTTVTTTPPPPVTVTVTTTSSATTTKAATLTCPKPHQLASLGYTMVWTSCTHGNAWIFAGAVQPTGEPIDGISVVQQTSAGKFKIVAQGSDFEPDSAGYLRSHGVPDDVITDLTSGHTTSNPQTDYPASDFVGSFERHDSQLVISSNNTGSMLLGDGCCNSTKFSLKYEYSLGVLQGTITGKPTTTGTGFSDSVPSAGTLIFFHLENGQTGPVVLSTLPGAEQDGPVVWCGAHQDERCGA